MGYEPTNWKTGDVITAEKLNKLEDGVGNAGGSGVSFIKIGEYNGYFSPHQPAKVSASPLKYNSFSPALKSIIDSGKTIINFVLDVSNELIELQGIYIDGLNVIVHQKDEGFIDLDDEEHMIKTVFAFTEDYDVQTDFTSTIYAVCI